MKLHLYSFWTQSAQWRGELGITQKGLSQNERPPSLLKLNKIVCYEKIVFLEFLTESVPWERGVGVKSLLKMGFYHNINDFFIEFWWNSAERCGTITSGAISTFKGGRELGSRKFQNFWMMKAWLYQFSLKLNKSMIYYEGWCPWNFRINSRFHGKWELGGLNPLYRGLLQHSYRIPSLDFDATCRDGMQ